MLIKAKYNGEDCLLNADYIVDIFDYEKMIAKAYVLDIDRDAYMVSQTEIKRLLAETNGTQTDCPWK